MVGPKIDVAIVDTIANAVWNKSQDIRDCVKIGALAKTMTYVEFIVDEFFLGQSERDSIL